MGILITINEYYLIFKRFTNCICLLMPSKNYMRLLALFLVWAYNLLVYTDHNKFVNSKIQQCIFIKIMKFINLR